MKKVFSILVLIVVPAIGFAGECTTKWEKKFGNREEKASPACAELRKAYLNLLDLKGSFLINGDGFRLCRQLGRYYGEVKLVKALIDVGHLQVEKALPSDAISMSLLNAIALQVCESKPPSQDTIDLVVLEFSRVIKEIEQY